MTFWRAFAAVLGALSVAVLMGIFAKASAASRRRQRQLLDSQPLLRFKLGEDEWRTFRRRELRKRLSGMILLALVISLVAGLVLALGAGRTFDLNVGELAGILVISTLLVVALTLERLWDRHYLRWSRRNPEIAIYRFGVAISGVLIDWTSGDIVLRDARVSPLGDSLELELEYGTSGGAAESWSRDVLALPLPQGVHADRILALLVRQAGSTGL